MTRALITTGVIALAALAGGCAPRAGKTTYVPTVVARPDPAHLTNNADWSKDAEGRMVIHIEFSRDMKRDTVVPRETLFLVTPRETLGTDGTCVWKSDRKMDFVTARTYDWLIPAPTAYTKVTLTLHGSREGPNSTLVITDQYGYAIDGDGDGVAGGNYTVEFGIPTF